MDSDLQQAVVYNVTEVTTSWQDVLIEMIIISIPVLATVAGAFFAIRFVYSIVFGSSRSFDPRSIKSTSLYDIPSSKPSDPWGKNKFVP